MSVLKEADHRHSNDILYTGRVSLFAGLGKSAFHLKGKGQKGLTTESHAGPPCHAPVMQKKCLAWDHHVDTLFTQENK